ncbi:MAG TPA: hypothetical protein VGP99_01480, partial [Tepidisphaeraceae bacterium]|nr:hypothetical protein [Tepidisphaeraceae bacterium]
MFRTLLVAFLFVMFNISSAPAASVTYTIDPTQSSLLASGTLSGNVPSSQTFGSNLTTYNGTISADRTATSIQFIAGSFIDADRQASKQRPDIGGEDGSAVADYGLQAPNSFSLTYAAFRDLVFDLSSDPLTVAGNGNFDSSFNIFYASGSVDWNSGFQWDSRDFTGSDLFNQSSGTPSVVVANGVETLTLPVRFSKIFSTETTGDSTFRLSGTLVATRSLNNNPPQWIKDGGGSWNDSANWDGGIPNGASASASFLGALTAANSPAIVTLDGDQTVGTVNFDNPNTYEIAQGSSGTLTLGNAFTPAAIMVAAGRHVISAPLVLAGQTSSQIAQATSLSIAGNFRIADNQSLTTSGGGVLTISGVQNHGQDVTINVSGGELRLNSDAGRRAIGPIAAQATLTLHLQNGASRVTLNADQDLQLLAVNFSEAGSQSFDLNSPAENGAYRSVRIYDAIDVTKQSLYAAMINAHDNPEDGIFDSGLASHPSSGLGIAFFNDPTGSQYLLIRPTRTGDLNLDGIVSIADFIDLA